MKFDFIIGNPPYQETRDTTKDMPVYNAFMDSVFDISDNGSTGGKKFTVYSAYYKASGQKWVEGNTQVSVGDEVVIAGKVVNYRGTTPEFADKQSYVVSINGF